MSFYRFPFSSKSMLCLSNDLDMIAISMLKMTICVMNVEPIK